MGTKQDVFGNLRSAVPNLNVLMRQAAELAGQIVVRLTHEHELLLDYGRYKQELQMFQNKIVDYNKDIRVRAELAGVGLSQSCTCNLVTAGSDSAA